MIILELMAIVLTLVTFAAFDAYVRACERI
jgi:hypothetical protein